MSRHNRERRKYKSGKPVARCAGCGGVVWLPTPEQFRESERIAAGSNGRAGKNYFCCSGCKTWQKLEGSRLVALSVGELFALNVQSSGAVDQIEATTPRVSLEHRINCYLDGVGRIL